jgi:hypothetical protein
LYGRDQYDLLNEDFLNMCTNMATPVWPIALAITAAIAGLALLIAIFPTIRVTPKVGA